jgi:pimeloyl-ACP methyl ester carboxylesterase
VLVLAASWNSRGDVLIVRPEWQEFATKNNLGLVGLSFASEKEALMDGTGYYYASRGSGKLLLEGIERIYGEPLPILIYGFSGGAQFTTRLVEWAPERVLGWCACGAGWYDKPTSNPATPPGIVSSGDEDLAYGPAIGYFMQGRKVGKPWLWLPLARTDHAIVPQLDEFVRKYFSVILDTNPKKGAYVDIHLRTLNNDDARAVSPKRTGFLPDESLFEPWIAAQQPGPVNVLDAKTPETPDVPR